MSQTHASRTKQKHGSFLQLLEVRSGYFWKMLKIFGKYSIEGILLLTQPDMGQPGDVTYWQLQIVRLTVMKQLNR